jgi:transcriptional regulator with XRE-family HTH domain
LKPAGSVLGAHLREARLRAGLTLRELGLMLRPTTHPSTISNWERGKRVPRQASIVQLADLFSWGTKEAASPARSWRSASGAGVATRTAGPADKVAAFERLLDDLRTAYEDAFQEGRAVGHGEAQKELQLLRKQLASERDRVERQHDQLVQLQRSAEMRRLAEDPSRS